MTPKTKYRELSASEITQQALLMLKAKGFEVWRQNQIPVRGRIFTGRKGQSDIMGFERATGRMVAAEVKKIGDTLKPDQIEFLGMVKKSGAHAFVVRQVGSEVKIEDYAP
jgi:hypothetical protein